MPRSILLLMIAGITCSRAPQVTPQAIAGCYVVGWPRGIPQLAAPFPDTLRLDLARTTDPRATIAAGIPRRRVEVIDSSGEPFRAFLFWWQVERDSITVVKSDGYSGGAVRMAIRDNAVSGAGYAFSDVVVENGPPAPMFPVIGQRIACPN
jgi:hypothetical protein